MVNQFRTVISLENVLNKKGQENSTKKKTQKIWKTKYKENYKKKWKI